MSREAGPARLVSFSRNTCARSWRHSCRLLAPLVLGLIAQTSTGCTLVGYGVGSAHTAAPQLLGPENVRSIPVGTEVEVSYSPDSSEHVPIAGPPSVQGACAPTAEPSVVTGAYGGIEGRNLVLEHEVLRHGPAPEDYSSGGSSLRFEIERASVPLACVKSIRTKPSLTPRIAGTLIGAALDVAVIVLYANAVRDIQ